VDVHVDRERVEAITAIDPGGVTHRIRARQFVVAANGVDSCLLLQRSRDVPKHAMLGRCYMDHPSFELAIYGSGLDARPGYGDSAQTGMITTFFEEVGNDLPVSMLGEIRLTDPLAQNTARSTVVREVTRLAMEGQYSRAPTFRERFDAIFRSTIYLKFLVEMQPSRENTLSIQEINATGQAQPRLAIHLPTYFDECERRVKASIEARLPGAIVRVLRRYSGEQHWMGATRMANDPRQGCVDENLRYHGLENLWVLSASTFPSCSSANPTLTLSALALRLGDHLAAAPPAGP
jgi:hypothetical protein